MALPVLTNDKPMYDVVVPSLQQSFKFRPFLVKEQKSLLVAYESQDMKQILNAMLNCIETCVPGIKINELATFDIDYVFTQLRAKSVGETAQVQITCPDDDKTKVPILIKLDDIKIKTSKEHSKDIKLDDNLTLRMKYPSMKEFIKSNFSVEGMKPEDTFDLIISCIEQVYSQEESWSASDCTKDEMNEFLDQLNSTQFKEIEKFFETMPKLSHTLKVKNPKTNVINDIKLEGLTAFFG